MACAQSFGIGGLLLIILSWRVEQSFIRRAPSLRRLLYFSSYFALFYLAIEFAPTRADFQIVLLLNYLWPSLAIALALKVRGGGQPIVHLLSGFMWVIAGEWIAFNDGLVISESAAFGIVAHAQPCHLLAVCGALVWALYTLSTSREPAPKAFLFDTGILLLATSALVGLGSWLATGTFTLPPSSQIDEFLFLTAGAASAYLLWNIAVRGPYAIRVLFLSRMTPILSIVIGGLYLGISLSFCRILGATVIAFGMYQCAEAMKGRKG